jgi:hypothetical protein
LNSIPEWFGSGERGEMTGKSDYLSIFIPAENNGLTVHQSHSNIDILSDSVCNFKGNVSNADNRFQTRNDFDPM